MSLTIEVQEPNEEWIKEGYSLFEEHYKEIAAYQDIPLDPDYNKYLLLADAGKLLILTAKLNGELVGYVIYVIDHATHYKGSLQAMQDVLFVKKDKRKSVLGCGYFLLKKSEQVLKEMGVQVVYQHVKVAHDYSPLLDKLGYEKVETIHQKRLN